MVPENPGDTRSYKCWSLISNDIEAHIAYTCSLKSCPVCVYDMCVFLWVCTCMYAHALVIGVWSSAYGFFHYCSPFIFETLSPTEHGVHSVRLARKPQGSASTSPALRLDIHAAMPSLLRSFWGSKLGPQACIANTLPLNHLLVPLIFSVMSRPLAIASTVGSTLQIVATLYHLRKSLRQTSVLVQQGCRIFSASAFNWLTPQTRTAWLWEEGCNHHLFPLNFLIM